jgi:hypothetical protein
MPDDKRPKRPRDINQIAYQIVEESTRGGSTAAARSGPPKNPAAVALGKLGAEKGGKERARKLSAEQRKEIAQKAARARWSKK